MQFNIDYLCAFGNFITHKNQFDGKWVCLGNYMRQHCHIGQNCKLIPNFAIIKRLTYLSANSYTVSA